MTIREKFKGTPGGTLHVEQNDPHYTEDGLLYVRTGTGSGMVLSLSETIRLREFLDEVIAANTALKPNVPQQIRDMATGTIFKSPDSGLEYVKLDNGKTASLDHGMVIQPHNYSGVEAIEIVYDPTKGAK